MKHQSQLIRFDREFRQLLIALNEQLRTPKPLPLVVNGLSDGATEAFCVECVREAKAQASLPSLLLASDEKEAQSLRESLEEAGLSCLSYPTRDLLFDFISASHDTERERLFVLHSLLSGEVDAVIASPTAALSFTMPKEMLTKSSLSLSVGAEMDVSTLVDTLISIGYVRTETVESVGQFACRGGIVDIFCHGAGAVRAEFFGDEVDRLGIFDPLSQRVSEDTDSVLILPAREVLYTDEQAKALSKSIEAALQKPLSTSAEKTLKAELAALRGKTDLYSRDKYISYFYRSPSCLFDFLPHHAPVFLIGSSALLEQISGAEKDMAQTVSSFVENGLVQGKYAVYSKQIDDFNTYLSERTPLYVNRFSGVASGMACAGLFGFRCRRSPAYGDNFSALCTDISDLLATKYRVLILCESHNAATALKDALWEKEIPCACLEDGCALDGDTLPFGAVRIGVGVGRGGFDLVSAKTARLWMGEDKSTVRRRVRTAKRKKVAAGEQILSYNELKKGDFVVHEVHGIGRFEGITTMTLEGVSRDYITIAYAGTDTLFIPADRLELITKYIGAGAENGTVKLSKMGSKEWEKAKSRAKGAAKALAKDLLALYAARASRPGFAYPPDGDLEKEFDGAFEYEETEPQLLAIDDIKEDMQKPVPMDRLLCGDVGFGKTEVALRAAFKAIAAGKQVALLVPTTILAMQHYQTALSRMRGFPVSVEMLSRFRTPTEQGKILRRLARGDIDLLVGTHALLAERVKFKDLGLLIVDEEQRFGVAQKEKLKQMTQNVDVLTLTATPIPRTLHMAMSGIRDMSILDEAPSDRFPVQTYVCEHDDEMLFEAMRRELRRGGQVLYLHNRTDTIMRAAHKVAEALPDAAVAYAHGQMDKAELEQIWQSLVSGEIDILLCTTIIETGVDLPNANTLIIENADRMGLSQLHQLRGRVGRSGRRAYAYFTFRAGKALSEIATKRLEAIREYAEFGAGFRIAMRDLEIRGAGDILGAQQHGNIESVGYDLYVRLLQNAILEEQGTAPAPAFEATVDMRVDALIPEKYLPSASARMEMYKKISHIETEEDKRDVLDEFCDRFGEPPAPVLTLLEIAKLRAQAAVCRIKSIEERNGEVCFKPERIDLALWSELFASEQGLRMTGGASPYISIKVPRREAVRRAAAIMEKYYALYKETNT